VRFQEGVFYETNPAKERLKEKAHRTGEFNRITLFQGAKEKKGDLRAEQKRRPFEVSIEVELGGKPKQKPLHKGGKKKEALVLG